MPNFANELREKFHWTFKIRSYTYLESKKKNDLSHYVHVIPTILAIAL
jgi:hypothetical protein